MGPKALRGRTRSGITERKRSLNPQAPDFATACMQKEVWPLFDSVKRELQLRKSQGRGSFGLIGLFVACGSPGACSPSKR
jgi:hypothetical protein